MKPAREFRYWLAFALSFLVMAVLWIVLVLWLYRREPSPDEFWVEKVLAVKHAARERAGDPCLVVTAGSSGLFGMRTELLAEGTGVPAVNAATYARLGMQGFFDDLYTFVRPGDAVLVAFEYEHFSGDYLQKRYASHLLRNHLDMLPSKPVGEIFHVLFSPTYEEIRLRLKLQRDVKNGVDVYVFSREFAESVDTHGDFVRNTPEAKGPFKPERPLQKLFHPISPGAKAVFAKNVQRLRDMGVTVFAVHPPKLLAEDYWEAEVKQYLAEYRAMLSELKIPLAEAMWLRRYPNDEFYDDDSHLNSVAAEARTKAVAEELSKLPEFQAWKTQRSTP